MTTCARSGRCSRRRQDVSAHGLSARARSASSISGSRSAEIPVGHGQTRRGWVVVACLGYSRAGAGALIFSKQTPDLLAGIAAACGRWGRCRRRWSGIARPGCTPAAAARPRRSPRSAASCGSAGTSASRRDPQAKGVVERLQDFIERSFEPGRCSRTSSTSSCSSTPGSPSAPTRACTRRCAAAPDRPPARGARGDGAAAGRGARHRPALGRCGSRPIPTCASTPTTTRWTRAGRPPRRGHASPSARSSRSRWTPASSPAATRGRSPGIGRSPRSSTPARCAPARRRGRAEPRSRSGRSTRYDQLIA